MGGKDNQATSPFTAVSGGQNNGAHASHAAVLGGEDNLAVAEHAAALGGKGNMATAPASWVVGLDAKATITGSGARASGKFAQRGDAQSTSVILLGTSDSADVVTLAQGAATEPESNQRLGLVSGCAVLRGVVLARDAASGDSAAWEVTALVHRGALSSSAAIVGAPAVTVIGKSPGAADWGVALVIAHSASGAYLDVQVTGAAAQNIRWMLDVSAFTTLGDSA